jgi:Fe-S cluster biogenesis protein NfuA
MHASRTKTVREAYLPLFILALSEIRRRAAVARIPAPDPEARRRIEHIETLIHNLERVPDPAARDQARELVQTLLDFHETALARLLGRVADMGEPGYALITSLADDDIVSSLLLLYGLHPLDLKTRVEQALERVRPLLRSHHGDVELVGITNGVVRLRMQGSCHGCPSSALTLKNAIEGAIYAAAPDVAAIEVEGVVDAPPSHLLQIVPLDPRMASRALA